jgi:hypothetical protein
MYNEYGELTEEYVNNAADEVSVSNSSSVSLTSDIKRRRKMMEDLKRTDKDYHKIYRYVDGKKKSIEIYTTNCLGGGRIRSAIGGSYNESFRIGSKDEDIFFKVTMATGECGKDLSVLFFDSPEQYERHLCVSVSQDIKEKWYEKFNRERVARS